MPRRPRDLAAGTFHVFTHCVWAAPALFRDDIDRMGFLRLLARTTATTAWTCHAYCLMGTHYHLLVSVEDNVLPRSMHRLNLPYARDFNRRHKQRGHVQFRPYGAGRIRSDSHLLDRFAYLALNPVEAGLCSDPADWPWSSFAATVGLAELPSFVDPAPLYACFPKSVDPRAELRAFVARQMTVP